MSARHRPAPARRVVIVAGTHGNELTGPWLLRKWRDQPDSVERPSFTTVVDVGNPRALQRVVRYIDQDLNRSFLPELLADQRHPAYEVGRARELVERFGPAGTEPADVLFDLHNTTANMGVTLILVNPAPFNVKLAAYVTQRVPDVHVYCWLDQSLPRRSLTSVVERGIVVEVGPVANGIVRGDLFEKTEHVVGQCLDFIHAHNEEEVSYAGQDSVECFTFLEERDFPRDASGEIVGYIHPDLQDKDFRAIVPGHPIFQTFDGRTIPLECTEPEVYPVFVNEAAYYEKHAAFYLATKRTLSA